MGRKQRSKKERLHRAQNKNIKNISAGAAGRDSYFHLRVFTGWNSWCWEK